MTTTETITNNFDHQTSLSPIRRQAPYDLQPKIGHTYVESPSHTRPSSGFQRPSSRQHHEELPPETPSRRPKTTHVSSPRKRWSQIEDAEDSFDAPDVPPSPSIRPMTSIYRWKIIYLYSLHSLPFGNIYFLLTYLFYFCKLD